MRVVTTLPSATEIVAALGVEPVGVSHECDYPPGAADAPAVTSARIDAAGSSDEIDRAVREAAGASAQESDDGGGGVYDVDAATLDRLDPDLIVTQGVCDVCAVDEVVVERAVDRIDADPAVLTTDPHTVDDVLADVMRIGRTLDREDRAAALVADLEARMDAVRARIRALPPETRPGVAVLDWTDPVMVAGHWVPELVEAAGGRYGLAEPGEASRPREWAAIREYDPEVLVVAPCGFDLAQTARNRADLTGREGWAELAAVREGRVWAMDGDAYVNRPGPRLVDTLEALSAIVHPEGTEDHRPPTDLALPLDDLDAIGAERGRPGDGGTGADPG